MRKIYRARVLALIVASMLALPAASPGMAQSNNYYLQQQRAQQAANAARQAQQQAQQAQQRQQQMMQQQQRMQQQRQQAARQQQLMQQQQRTQQQNQQRAANSNAIRQRPSAGAVPRQNLTTQRQSQQGATYGSTQSTAIKGSPTRNVSAREGRGFVSSGGIAKLTRPMTPGDIKKGFTGRITGDGRALVKFQGRIFAVPARGLGLVPPVANQNGQGSRWTVQQRQGMAAKAQALAARRAAGAGSGGSLPPSTLRRPANDNRTAAIQARLRGAWLRVPAERVNAELRNRGYLQEPFPKGSSVFAVRTKKPEEFVRFYGGGSGAIGRFIARKADIVGKTPEQIKAEFGLENIPKKMVPVTLPADTIIYTGDVAEQANWQSEGGSRQYFIPETIRESDYDVSRSVDMISNSPIELR